MFVTETSELIIQMKISMSLYYDKKHIGMSISPLSMMCIVAGTYCVIKLIPVISGYLCASCWQLLFS
jgi:hypothetical protein